jgi:hypothetical protein
MDEKTFFFIGIGIYFLYQSFKLYPVITKNIFEYYEFFDLFNSNVLDVYDVYETNTEESEKEESEKQIIKYEDKFLNEIRKLDKEYIFDEREKELLKEKEISFLNDIKNDYKNKIEKIKNRLCDIESDLSNLERNDSTNEFEEEEYETKEERIKILNQEKSNLYVDTKKLDDLLDSEKELVDQSNESAFDFVISQRLEKLLNCYIMENTPQGNVLMIYDIKKGSFKYYSDHTIPYRYLEVVGRKYVKLFNCRPLYVDMEEELKISEEKWEKERKEEEKKEEEKKEKEKKNEIFQEKKSVFAKFKSYNKEGTSGRVNVGVPPKNSISIIKEQQKDKILLKEKANRYTYEGKMVNFNFLKKIDRKLVDKKYGISFADFKKINKN